MSQRRVVICSPTRTPIGTFGGSLKTVPAPDLGATAIRGTLERSGLDPAAVDTVVMGNVIQAGCKMNPARQASINGGVPAETPALTVNRVCGSGAQAIANAFQEVALGFADTAVAGGMENMDRAPYLLMQGRYGYRLGHQQILDAVLSDGLNDAFSDQHSGWHTEDLAEQYQISRQEQDEWALRSQQRFSAAQSTGHFEAEITPVDVPGRKGPTRFEADEHNRGDTTLEGLQKLRPAFRKEGTITAGNAPGVNTGAAAMVVAEEEAARKHGLTPAARLVAYGVGGVEPGMFGIGPVPAVRQCLQRAGWSADEVGRWEINEAFAAIAIAVTRDLGLDPERVNVEGGAVAHGHPIGATGAVLTTRLIHAMQRDGVDKGVVTMCIGGGQGVALAIERV
ncbi:thiolase family protein [Halorhodospira halophila]|uniref:Acetyl-CoA acetyltransferase n=1 Tax=Halorhodospira halophila (strain DSM 244 / SL1) TaxID=349124 RepID=A1WXN7_HALHL|nr:acetyl-CoA C-acetyltransferase [Halorhodospira halophila]ABM62449.1 acetyl-CoA acetyltransferase [Halorhodospira halophila SL1]MBK1729578.1 acetyl-CoA C-acetyltransferase [Halorhodospira halophila]